jgi:hypothetical protein
VLPGALCLDPNVSLLLQGANLSSIEPPGGDINDVCVLKDSGLLMLALDAPRLQNYFIPALGPAPRWCSFLDNLTVSGPAAPPASVGTPHWGLPAGTQCITGLHADIEASFTVMSFLLLKALVLSSVLRGLLVGMVSFHRGRAWWC